MANKIQCTICLDYMQLCGISALTCGHTFHFHCIQQWLYNYKTCPVCRTRAAKKDLVRQLYFQTEEKVLDESSDPLTLQMKLRDITEELVKEKKKSTKAIEDVEAFAKEKRELVKEVERLGTAAERRLQQLQNMEIMLTNQQYLEKELEMYKKRLEACEFYRLLTVAKDDNVVNEIDKYIGSHGLEVTSYILLLRKQLSNAVRTIEKQRGQLTDYEAKFSILYKKMGQLRMTTAALRSKSAVLRKNLSKSLANAALEKTTVLSPEQRLSVEDSVAEALGTFSLPSSSDLEKAIAAEEFKEPTFSGNMSNVSVNESEGAISNHSKKKMEQDGVLDLEEVFVPPAVRKFSSSTKKSHCEAESCKRKHVLKCAKSVIPLKKAKFGAERERTNGFLKANLNETIVID